jgi:NADPH:quinone reductase-like Zn-dependent oxidoreductase
MKAIVQDRYGSPDVLELTDIATPEPGEGEVLVRVRAAAVNAADRVAAKPARLTYEEAAALPPAGMTALQGLRDAAEVRPGQRVLINGASGGVGLFAVQLGKAFGAEATGVCRTRNVDLVRSAGADHVIDTPRTTR